MDGLLYACSGWGNLRHIRALPQMSRLLQTCAKRFSQNGIALPLLPKPQTVLFPRRVGGHVGSTG
jgi:hypothetical protein